MVITGLYFLQGTPRNITVLAFIQDFFCSIFNNLVFKTFEVCFKIQNTILIKIVLFCCKLKADQTQLERSSRMNPNSLSPKSGKWQPRVSQCVFQSLCYLIICLQTFELFLHPLIELLQFIGNCEIFVTSLLANFPYYGILIFFECKSAGKTEVSRTISTHQVLFCEIGKQDEAQKRLLL